MTIFLYADVENWRSHGGASRAKTCAKVIHILGIAYK
jgi:hypothetical protein